MKQRVFFLFGQAKKIILFFGVVFYFLVGTISSGPHQSIANDSDWIFPFSLFFHENGLTQFWAMFSPPQRHEYRITYSIFTEMTGWSEPIDPLQPVAAQMKHRVFMPRGATRLIPYFSASTSNLDLDRFPSRRAFFNRLSDYYCFGLGKIPEVKKIRFSFVTRGVEDVFKQDEFGSLNPSAEEQSNTVPIYESDCK